jgi:alpha-soluble NSF attachment protein
MQHYQLAADYFRGEESNSAANKCLLKVNDRLPFF